MHNHQQFYFNNKKYTTFLDSHPKDEYVKYIAAISLLAQKKLQKTGIKSTFLDVGCGTGSVLQELGKREDTIGFGIEISKSSIEACIKKGISARLYDGEKIPHKSNTFDIVGSYNVLEHTDNPILFLNEKYRVLKPGGFLIIATPNFFSFSNNYHHKTIGILNKVKNIFQNLFVLVSQKIYMPKMKPISRENFQPDDDAVNQTNPLSIILWATSKNMKQIYWSSQLKKSNNNLIRLLDKTVCKIGLGASFQVFQKK